MKLWYYAHRFRDASAEKRRNNLLDAFVRFHASESHFASRGRILWAPWLQIADAGVPEEEAWLVIDKCVRISSGIVLDLDGADEPSPGMIRERDIMLAVGGKVEVVR